MVSTDYCNVFPRSTGVWITSSRIHGRFCVCTLSDWSTSDCSELCSTSYRISNEEVGNSKAQRKRGVSGCPSSGESWGDGGQDPDAVFVTQWKEQKIRDMSRRLMRQAMRGRRWVSMSTLRSICGTCVALMMEIPWARCYTRALYCDLSGPKENGHAKQTQPSVNAGRPILEAFVPRQDLRTTYISNNIRGVTSHGRCRFSLRRYPQLKRLAAMVHWFVVGSWCLVLARNGEAYHLSRASGAAKGAYGNYWTQVGGHQVFECISASRQARSCSHCEQFFVI